MSVEYQAKIIVGVPMEKVDFSTMDKESVEDLVNDFFFTSDAWCGGQEFLGEEVLVCENGKAVNINDIQDLNFFDIKLNLHEDLQRYGAKVDFNDIQIYLLSTIS